MARAKSPLMSMSASKQLGKALIYKTRGSRNYVTRYNKPGGQNPFTPSASQEEKRDLYFLANGLWDAMTDGEKAEWNEQAQASGKNISGWNYFLKAVMDNPQDYDNTAFYGYNRYGVRLYGKQVLR